MRAKLLTIILTTFFVSCSWLQIQSNHEKTGTMEDLGQNEEEALQERTPPILSEEAPASYKSAEKFSAAELVASCKKQLQSLGKGLVSETELKDFCTAVEVLPGCESHEGEPIFHYDRPSSDGKGQRILALALIHGDEFLSGTVALAWSHRLSRISPRNAWRVIPVANPDGVRLKTRMNAKGVDLNRNFPTEDWDESALGAWRDLRGSDPRRYPGPSSASEIETQCYIQHFEGFKPDFIISIHTPLGVLDFDGPQMTFPHFDPLPWVSLGNFPGSLGRYMWRDNQVPVLTIELKGTEGVAKLEQFDQLQDVSGTVAIQSDRVLKRQAHHEVWVEKKEELDNDDLRN